jgi:hypothetical protein
MGIDDVRVFDAHIEVYAGTERIKINYDTYALNAISNDTRADIQTLYQRTPRDSHHPKHDSRRRLL